ncbi:hypothetical protein BDN72DRAFT_957282 [Pluteus cervinus]|uniref:Uncharacterized protein n=1 Tax=Pluteus cervinus TaxID=181527 RepID=A0ACD3B445_9AGAR|nr:hypothetical protein BDN72DRAFT_957282 [Pluteus cervinus]
MNKREPYGGRTRKLVVALDVGTTFSGVSYCLLDPGQVPEIKGVTRFPYQELASADSKIPTVIWYDKDGNVREVGAGAMRDGVESIAAVEEWFKADLFKLHLSPKHLRRELKASAIPIPPLPPGKTIVDVFTDFLAYLYMCTKTFISEHHPNGPQLWRSVQSTVEIVLSHPNGWEYIEQDKMRRAAIRAGLVPDLDEGLKRVHFVTEGEASLHYCISNNLNTEGMKSGGRILVIDAGGGTVDISAYERRMEQGKQFYGEMYKAECHFQGSIFVTENAKKYLQILLKKSVLKDDLRYICEAFDKTTKPRFRTSTEFAVIKYGGPRDSDPDIGINNGQLILPGPQVAEFFKPSVDCIVKAILAHQQSILKASTVFLVGGFSASDWLFKSIRSQVESEGVTLCRPDGHTNKVVADGAVSWHLDRRVSSRVSKFTYGVKASENYSESDRQHLRRKSRSFRQFSGRICIPGLFTTILPKDTKVKEQQEFRYSYHVELEESDEKLIHREIICYRGSRNTPKWVDEDPDHFETICTLEADLTNMIKDHPPVKGPDDTYYYTFDYDIIILFGMTELVAQIAWEEKGEEKRGPVRIVYNAV